MLKAPPIGSKSVGDGSHWLPSQALWNIWLSVPRPKMSRRSAPQETAAGGLLNLPPSGSQSVGDGSHWLPSQALWNIWLSVPRPKMSRRLTPQVATAIAVFSMSVRFQSESSLRTSASGPRVSQLPISDAFHVGPPRG